MSNEIEKARGRRELREEGVSLTHKQEKAVAALLSLRTIKEAADAAGVHERTLRKWMRDPSFEHVLRAARSRALETAVGKLSGAADEAVDALVRALTSGVVFAEIAAARTILDFSFKAEETFILADRLQELLDQVQEVKKTPW